MYDTLMPTRPYSVQAGLTSTPDGRWLFQAEGGSLVFLDASLGQAGYEDLDGIKRVPVGFEGVVPARLCLDPGAQAVPGTGANDILYVAGGRHGLWAIGADTDPLGSNPAMRLDDSGNLDKSSQSSRRWCVDVQTVHLGTEDYLLALFQRGGLNRLRIYELDAARDAYHEAVNAQAETGYELGPPDDAVIQVSLNSHPAVTGTGEPPEPVFGESIALAMDVDVLGPFDADVYVAMGHHGLARVRLHTDQIGVLDTTVQWGPVFGDGTTYAMSSSLYDHYRFYRKGVLQRSERPLFADVAVQNDAWGHHLYCAVDHLGWLRFDLSQTWGVSLSIDHQEGVQMAGTADEQIQLVGTGTKVERTGYAIGIELEEVPSIEGPILAVTVGPRPFIVFPFQFTEGVSVGSNTELGRVQEPLPGKERTLLYRPAQDATWGAPGYNFAREVPFGGRNLHVPPEQVITPAPQPWEPDQDRVVVYHTYSVPPAVVGGAQRGVCRNVVDLVGGPGNDLVFTRTIDHYLARYAQSIGYSVVDPDLLITGGNDGGLTEDGFLVTRPGGAGYEIRATHAGPFEGGQTGIVTNQESQYRVAGTATEQYVLCDGPKMPDQPLGGNNPKRYRVMRWDVTTDPFNVPAGHDFRVWEKFLNTPKDRFEAIGREEHRGWTYSMGFEAANPGLEDYPLFLANGYPTSQGALVVPRDDLIETQMAGVANGGEFDLDGLVSGQPPYGLRLRTHPEFDNMLPVDASKEWWQKTGPGSVNVGTEAYSSMYTWHPHVLRVADPTTQELTRWVVAVPCGKVWADPTWQIFIDPLFGGIGDPAWLPSQYWLDKLGRAMVQFWEIQPSGNTYTVVQGSTPEAPDAANTPLPRLFGPDENPGTAEDDQMAFRLASVELSGRVFLFVADFAGRLVVSDVTDILSGSPDQEWPTLFEWDPPEALVDGLRNNVQCVTIDKQDETMAYVYVAVRRVGIEVLKLTYGPPQQLDSVTRIQTAEDPWTIVIRDHGTEKDMVVTDYAGGIRIYED